MQTFSSWLSESQFAGISVFDLSLAVAAMLLSYGFMLLALRLASGRLRALAQHTSTKVDDVAVSVLASTNRGLLLLAAFLVGVSVLDLGPRWSERVGQAWFLALALQLALWLNRGIGSAVRGYEHRHGRTGPQLGASATLLSWVLRTVLWVVIVLALLSNLGVNITAFVASLGVGGVAVALAVQNILGDLFASMAIAVDKPFEVGDFIASSAGVGTVEYVGLKTTRLRALSGEQIVIGNTDLLKQPVQNFKRMQQRRIAFQFSVSYDTPPDQVEAIPGIVKQLVAADAKLRFDRAHLQALGESALRFEVVYFVLDADYNLYMDAQQRLNLGLVRAFAERGIAFALPARTVYLADPHGFGARRDNERPSRGGAMLARAS